MGKVWSTLEILNRTAEYLASKGIDTPRLDAEVLLGHCLGKSRVELYLSYDRPLIEEELARFRGVLKRRARREPVAYIIGKKEFWSLSFKVTRDVLIPRPETEQLVMLALERIPSLFRTGGRISVLDIGTGCGALAICLALELHERGTVLATDLSLKALLLAKENAFRLGCPKGISFVLSDLFPPMRDAAIDLLLSNPPYVPSSSIGQLEPEIREYEPLLAIDGGPDGLTQIRRIIDQSPFYLRPGGYLLLEVAQEQADRVASMMEAEGAFESIAVHMDLAGRKRIVEAQRRRDSN